MSAEDGLKISEQDALGYLIGALELGGVDIAALLEEEDRDMIHPPYHDFGDIYEGALADYDTVNENIQWIITAGIGRLLAEDLKRAKERAKDLVYDVLRDERGGAESTRKGTSKREFFGTSALRLVESLRRLKNIEQRLNALRSVRYNK